LRKHDAAEIETAVEALDCRHAEWRPPIAEAAAPLCERS
jgi:hypothetical protein